MKPALDRALGAADLLRDLADGAAFEVEERDGLRFVARQPPQRQIDVHSQQRGTAASARLVLDRLRQGLWVAIPRLPRQLVLVRFMLHHSA